MTDTEKRNLAKAVLRRLGVGKTESQEDALISIIGAFESLGVLDEQKARSVGAHGPIDIHVGERFR